MEIRKATAGDLDIVVKFAIAIARQHCLFNADRFFMFPEHEKLLQEYFAFELANEKSVISLLTAHDTIVGFAFVTMEQINLEQMALPRAWLCDIYIEEKSRKAGGGKLLIAAAEKAALELGSRVLMLHVAVQNKYAKDFFEKTGFRDTMTEMILPLEKSPGPYLI